MPTKGSMQPEFLQVCIVGDDMGEVARNVYINGQAKKQGLDRPLLVQPGTHRVSVTGFRPQEVTILGGETDFARPKIVEFANPADALSRDR